MVSFYRGGAGSPGETGVTKPRVVENGKGIRIGDLNLTIIKEIVEAGDDRRVYQVRDQHGKLYAYKHAKKRSVKKEVERTEAVKKAGVPYAVMVSSGPEYVLRQWVDGLRGDVWLKSWESFGAPLDIAAVEDLILLLDTSARAGLYIGKLDPEDMVWSETAERWYIVDCGGVTASTPRAAAKRYFWKILERWGWNFERYGKGLRSLFAALSPLGKDYPPEVPPEVQVVSVVSAPADSIAPMVFTPVSTKAPKAKAVKPVKPVEVEEDDDEDDDSSGDLPEGEDDEDDDDDDSSNELPVDDGNPSNADLAREELDEDDEDDASPDSERAYEESLKNPPNQSDVDMLGQVPTAVAPTKSGGLG